MKPVLLVALFFAYARATIVVSEDRLNPKYNCRNRRSYDNYCFNNRQLCLSGDPKVIGYMHRQCAHTCGFCLEQTCFDNALGCEQLAILCNNPGQRDWVRAACPKTCKVCHEPKPPVTIATTTKKPKTTPKHTTTSPTVTTTLSPAFDCKNGRQDTYCEINKKNCKSANPEVIKYMHEFCAHTCGFCLEQNCYDEVVGCEQLRSLCFSPQDGPWVRRVCKRSCGLCRATTTVKPTTTQKPTTKEQTTLKPTTTVKPTTEEPTTTVKPRTTVKPTTKETTTLKPTTTVKSTTQEETTLKPTTTVKATTEEQTTLEPTTTVKPTTVEETTVKPATTAKATTEEETTLEPTTTPKPTPTGAETTLTTAKQTTEEPEITVTLPFFTKVPPTPKSTPNGPSTKDVPIRTTEAATVSPGELCKNQYQICEQLTNACWDVRYIKWMEEFCPVTCQSCNVPCLDLDPLCPDWARHGFCENPGFPLEKRREVCAKSCKFCPAP
ncbi:hypothetical protein L596_026060 [Steinernema carpocapsae]|uniref:ShKT domain-containing protein n=1 Tax=Steinernema carpocapsae TaxID=34508 RepID=A0A4U5M073_STECR|nr:hypothetical protein L596_026060 [Steinernema carpocapsae]